MRYYLKHTFKKHFSTRTNEIICTRTQQSLGFINPTSYLVMVSYLKAAMSGE